MTTPHWPGEEREVGGYRLFVRTSAAARSSGGAPAEARATAAGRSTAVMVHGLGGQATNWTPLMAELADVADAWAPDLPGFGWSPPPVTGDYSLAADTELVAALVEQLHRERGGPVHLFGNSLGGAVTVMTAAARPDLVASLTLISPALPDLRPRRDTLWVPVVAVPGLGPRIYRSTARVPAERQVQQMVALNYGDAATFTEQRRAEAVAEVRRRLALPYAAEAMSGAARGLLRAFVDRGPRGLWAAASRVRCPTLLLYGGRDRLVDPGRSRRAARTMPQARVVILPRVGHLAQLEDPALVASFVRPMVGRS